MTRIAMISEHASPLSCLGGVDSGGQNVYVAQVSRHLSRLGFDVDVFTRRDDPNQPTVVHCGPGFRVIHVPAGPPSPIPKEDLLPHMEPFASFLEHVISRTQRYDLIHANFWMSGIVGARIKAKFNTPLIMTFHALGRVRQIYQRSMDRFPQERNQIEEQLMCDADRIIAECPQDEEDQVSLYGADIGKIRTIPCGFDGDEFWRVDRRDARKAIGADVDENLIVHIGRMVRRKGVDNVIRGFAQFLRRGNVSAKLMIIGGESDDPDPVATPEIGYLQSIAHDEGVASRVIFTGRRGRNELRNYYSAADVFVTTPWYEPFGITPVESMACGTPVIGANVGGIKHTVVDGETGYLVPPNNPTALSDALEKIYLQPTVTARMTRQALRRVNNQFTWLHVASEIADVYEEILLNIDSTCLRNSVPDAIAEGAATT